MSDLVALKPGTILADEYRIERPLGAGGFGITYLAEEIALARKVTIKEYFPVDFAARDQAEDVVPRSRDSEGDYSWGLDRFLAEAQTLARFNHPNIVRVYRFFQARNTGYIVLHYEEGASLKSWLKGLGRAPRQPELDRLIQPLLDALEAVHATDYLHRDIAPDNIMIRRDGQPVLIDFGSARGDIAKHTKTISALVKPGYSPYEQYATIAKQQGPWTDIYSLGSTLYEAVTGRRPPDAPSRMVSDELVPTADAALSSYRPGFLAAIDKALRLEMGERPRSVAEWRAELLAPAPPPKRAEPKRKTGPPPAEAARPASKPEVAAKPVASRGTDGAAAAGVAVMSRSRGDAAGQAGERRSGGLAAAFLEGWRKANPTAAPEAPAVASPSAQREPKPESKPEPKPEANKPETKKPRVKPQSVETPAASFAPANAEAKPLRRRSIFSRENKAIVPAPQPEPGARRATPRALRKRPRSKRGRGVILHLLLAVFVAAAVVAVQDHIPRVRHEGAGLLTSQTYADVALVELKGHTGPVTGLAYAPDGQQIVTASGDGTLKVWNAARGNLVRTLELDSGAASALAVFAGRAATGHQDGSIAVWDLTSGSKLASMRRNEAAIWALTFLGRPDRLAAAEHDWSVAIWDVEKPQAPANVLSGHESAVKAIAYSSRGPFIASGGADKTVKLWKSDTSELVRTYRGHSDFVSSVAFEPRGRTLASATLDGQIRFWSTYRNQRKRGFKAHDGKVPALAFMPDGQHLVSGGADGLIKVWNASRGKLIRTVAGEIGEIDAVAVSPDGRHVAAAGSGGSARVFSVDLSKEGS
ncbi:MAG: protein kinase [Hyphomicrobiaceae bacterium]